jgi:hypothetical protein
LAHSWFQYDGAPVQAQQVLDGRYPDSWIERGGPINWPAISPDFTPLDYFLWGHMKNYVYREPGELFIKTGWIYPFILG